MPSLGGASAVSPGKERRPSDLLIFYRLSQRQGSLIIQSRKLGVKLTIETEERAGLFGIKGLGEHIAIIRIPESRSRVFDIAGPAWLSSGRFNHERQNQDAGW